MNWTVNGNASKGKKMVADMQKLLLRAFNSECDDVIEHVKYNNIEASEKRITTSREAISKLGTIMEVSIQPKYYRLKIEELHLAFEYAQKKQQEKEEQKEARARMREEAKLAKEIEEERKKLETSHLLIGNHCRCALTSHHHIATNCRKTENLHTFLRIGMDKHHHWKKNSFYFFTPITPLMNFLLDRNKIFNPHFVQTLGNFLLVMHTNQSYIPTFRVCYAFPCPIARPSIY